MRREFTANVSHELKTPLTSISGYAELIETGMAKPDDVPTFAARIHKEAQRMIALVSDILQLSELDSTQASQSREKPAEMAPVDLAALLKETAQNMTVNARKAYVTLQYSAQPATVQLRQPAPDQEDINLRQRRRCRQVEQCRQIPPVVADGMRRTTSLLRQFRQPGGNQRRFRMDCLGYGHRALAQRTLRVTRASAAETISPRRSRYKVPMSA
jgi:signal transduction histidine kinase